MLNRVPGFINRNALLVLAGCGVISMVLYLQFITRPAFLFNLYTNPTNYGTMVGANRNAAFFTLGVFFILFLLYLTAWWATGKLDRKEGWFLVFGWGILFCIPFFLMYPYGARDIFDYIMRARVFVIYHQNPFIQTAAVYPGDPFFRYAWWTDFPSPYGPLWELIAGLGVRLAGEGVLSNILIFKLIAALFLFGTAGVVAITLNWLSPERAVSGTLLFLWNPVLLFEIVGNAHNDITMLFWVAASIWAAGTRHWKLTVWFLAVGAAFKFIPSLLLPAAGLLGFSQMRSWREKWKFFLISGAGCLVVWVAAYLPFWDGWQTLTFIKQGTLFTTSLPSLMFYWLQPVFGAPARQTVGYMAIFLTITFSFWMAFRLTRKPDWVTYTRTATFVFLFYVLITCSWYQNWYLLWPLTTAVFLPVDPMMMAVVILSFVGLVKPFVAMPIFTWLTKPPSVGWQEIRLTLTTQGLPWLISALLLGKSIMNRKDESKEGEQYDRSPL
jgi:alpha-1,6-mannosyltransferase